MNPDQVSLANLMSALVRAYAAQSTLDLKTDSDARWKFRLAYNGQSLVGFLQSAHTDPNVFEANPPTVANCVSAAYSYASQYRYKSFEQFRQGYYFKSIDAWVLSDEAINARWQESQSIGARALAVYGQCFGCNYEDLANWFASAEGRASCKELGIAL